MLHRVVCHVFEGDVGVDVLLFFIGLHQQCEVNWLIGLVNHKFDREELQCAQIAIQAVYFP